MNRRAQSTMEYLIFFSIIIAALITTQVYLKRGMQGRLKSTAEQLTEGLAYSLGATESFQTITRNVDELATSKTICRDKNGNPVDCNNNTTPKQEKIEIRIGEGNVNINQKTSRFEETLPLKSEPKRW